jgi:hypothetical protein
MSDLENDEPSFVDTSNTVLSSFSRGVALYLSQSVFPLIVERLEGRGVTITVEELMDLVAAPHSSNNNQPIPAVAFGGMAQPIIVPRKPVTTNTNVTNNCVASQNPLPGKCSYRFKRGENKGLFCTRPMAPGSVYCTNCVKTRKNLSKDTGVVPGVAPNTVVQGYTVPENQSAQLNVVVYDADRSLYREPTYNFIVHQQPDGIIAVLGRLSEDGHTFVPLSETEKEIAKSMGLKDGRE